MKRHAQAPKGNLRTLTSEISKPQVDEAGPSTPLLKSDRNPYSERISVGRGSTCDIILQNGHVSKVHAHFLRGENQSWELRDANSTNGTFINGTRITRGGRVPIKYGDTLRFGFMDTQFLNATRLYDWLRRR